MIPTIVVFISIIGIIIYLINEDTKPPMNYKPITKATHVIPPPHPWRPAYTPIKPIVNDNKTLALPTTLLAGEKKHPPRALFFSKETTEEGEYEERFLSAFELRYWNENKYRIIEEEKTKKEKLALAKENIEQNQECTDKMTGSGEEMVINWDK